MVTDQGHIMTATLSKTQFKPRMLALLRQVEETGEDLILTDRGVPVVKIISLKIGQDLESIQRQWTERLAAAQVCYDPDEAIRPLPPEAWGDLA